MCPPSGVGQLRHCTPLCHLENKSPKIVQKYIELTVGSVALEVTMFDGFAFCIVDFFSNLTLSSVVPVERSGTGSLWTACNVIHNHCTTAQARTSFECLAAFMVHVKLSGRKKYCNVQTQSIRQLFNIVDRYISF
jgi:hypothetical protein